MADVRKVYVDACCFIDMVKISVGKRLTKDIEQDVWFLKRLLEANRDKEINVFTSTLSIAECTHVGDPDISDKVKAQFRLLLMSGQYVRLVQMTPYIAEVARDLKWTHRVSIRGADGIHVASALEMHCEEFLSTNGRLERIEKNSVALTKLGLSIKRGKDTQCLPDKYRQIEAELRHGKAEATKH